MINFFVQMKLNKFAYLYSKPLGNHTLKIMKKIPGNSLKNLEKSWKYHGILSVRKSGNPEIANHIQICTSFLHYVKSPEYLFVLSKFMWAEFSDFNAIVRMRKFWISKSEEFHFSDSLDSLHEMKFNPRQMRLNQTLENWNFEFS